MFQEQNLPITTEVSVAKQFTSSIPTQSAKRIQLAPLARLVLTTALLCLPQLSYALSPIYRPYMSVRSVGMGGVKMTTGLYDENFFNNPARVVNNPFSKFTLLDFIPIDTNSATPSLLSQLNGKDTVTTVANTAGKSLYGRTQIILPAYYSAWEEDSPSAFAMGLIFSAQGNGIARKSYTASGGALADIGIAATYGRTFLEDDSLALGLTGHLIYRVGALPSYSILQYIQDGSFGVENSAGEGAMYDFDLGTTYAWGDLGEFEMSSAVAVQNILGGHYTNIPLRIMNLNQAPPQQARSYGVGISMSREEWGDFADTVFAVELTDILNNANGSFFRLLHLGAETHWGKLAIRAGINQGYFTFGLGLDFDHFSLSTATYGEELGLNAGSYEDRRFTFNFGFHI